ncbi:MAG TPA: sulfite oxidase-like oxidoreductase [Thermodesulfobacteriota bacterium]
MEVLRRGVRLLVRGVEAALAARARPRGGWWDRPADAPREIRNPVETSSMPSRRDRLPPGQILTERWPVLHYGPVPPFDPKTWDFEVFGLCESPFRLSYEAFEALPRVSITADMHCVTTWSRYDMRWEGVHVREIVVRARPRPEARFVIVHCEHGYTTNLPLDEFAGEDCLFADAESGRPLSPEHGFPLRLVVPGLYAWKSAKWVRKVEFAAADRPGFWEVRGYHNRADPWKEERYSE